MTITKRNLLMGLAGAAIGPLPVKAKTFGDWTHADAVARGFIPSGMVSADPVMLGPGDEIRVAGIEAVAWAEHQEILMAAPIFAELTDRAARRNTETLKDLFEFEKRLHTEAGKAFAEHHIDRLMRHLLDQLTGGIDALRQSRGNSRL